MLKTLICVLLVISISFADDITKSFKGLKEVYVEYLQGIGHVTVLYNPTITKVIDKEEYSKYYDDTIKVVLQTKIDAKGTNEFIIKYWQGFSYDPLFSFSPRGKKDNEIDSLGCTTLIIPGDGYIYTAGHTNSKFDVRQKFELVGNKFKEVKQAYYYVGLKTETNQSITLYASKKMKKEVTRLRKGTKIEVLLNESNDYLIKTEFGLIGWYHMNYLAPAGVEHKSSIKGIFVNGD